MKRQSREAARPKLSSALFTIVYEQSHTAEIKFFRKNVGFSKKLSLTKYLMNKILNIL